MPNVDLGHHVHFNNLYCEAEGCERVFSVRGEGGELSLFEGNSLARLFYLGERFYLWHNIFICERCLRRSVEAA